MGNRVKLNVTTMTQTKSVTLKQIAEMAGCSTAVASTVLNNSRSTLTVSDKTRERVQEIAKQHNYRPHLAARMMQSRKSWQVGILLLDTLDGSLAHPSIFEMVQGINEGLERAGYLMSIVRMADIERENSVSTRLFEGHLLDGLIVVNIVPPAVVQRIDKVIDNLNLPCVWVDTNVWKSTGCIRRDEVYAGSLATKALIALGYKKLLLVNRPFDDPHYSFMHRLKGIREAVKKQNVELEVFDMPPGAESSYEVMTDLLRLLSPEVGVVTLDAYGAQKIALAASSLHLQAGYHYGLVCCDDLEHSTERQWPGLCRVGFDRYGMGIQAAEMLLSGLAKPEFKLRSREIQGHWVIGNSAWGPGEYSIPRL